MFALLRNATFQGLLGAVILAVAVGSMVAKAPLHLDYVDMSGKTVIVTGRYLWIQLWFVLCADS